MPSELEKARKLVKLAVHPKTPETEAFASAMAACRLIQAHNLLRSLDLPDAFDGDEVPPPFGAIPREWEELGASLWNAFQKTRKVVKKSKRASRARR